MATKKKSRSRKSSGRRYSKGASKNVASAMRRKKRGTLRSGRGGKGGKVKSRNLRGLYVAPTGEILERDVHVMEVNLSLGYPRRAPQCRMLTPVFHPNFDDSMVCIGDFWAASEGLDDLIIRIGRMIAYQEYNTKSPLNGLAAKWAAQNSQLLPIDPRPVAPPFKNADSQLQPPAAAENATAPALVPPLPKSDPWAEKIVIEREG